ncbi:hypothetical protein HXX76_005883 [Chlamydomonas incerta]|uniref:Apple domain-containing protein n=1 Tax=Chlamydomonas incerta TaxID=51695 RepID=A0A835TEA9_CHLIN|nr:hypothetical protein HXX76_005883 [Chlamydomonas incerta]|eukprot:KAG2437220.1 hypothetical protein HXX76_005883 [Chlamydomonas incerta]
MPIFLLGTTDGSPMPLLTCYTAALEANLTYFAIADVTDCFGGDEMVQGWAPDTCPLDCVPDGTQPAVCGGINKASVFSMGLCQYLGAPCAPDEAPPPPPPLTVDYCYDGCYVAADLDSDELNSTTSVAACQVLNANGGGADLFGITSGDQCLALYTLPTEKVDTLRCTIPCDEGTPCGADGYVAVYAMGACPSPPPLPPSPPQSPFPSPPVASPPPPRPIGQTSPPPPPPSVEDLNPPPIEDESPPPPSPLDEISPSPPPPSGPVFRCKEGISLWGVFLPNTPVKLNPTKSHEENQVHCEELCADNDACLGYYYKTTRWCFLMKEVYSFGKEYNTAIIACKKF